MSKTNKEEHIGCSSTFSVDIILKAFVVGLVIYLSYFLVFGTVLGRDDLGDKAFHYAHAQHPLTFTKGDYYAPLLHLITYPLTLVMPVGLAFSIIVPIILFLLLPITFVFAWSAFDFGNADSNDSEFHILFVAYLIPFCVFNCTWAQALNMSFVLMSLGIMFMCLTLKKGWKSDGLEKLLAVFVFLGFFSHTEGGLWLLAIFLIYLLLQKDWINMFLAIAIIGVVAYCFPFLFVRPHTLIASAVDNVQFNLGEWLRIVVLWINPLAVWLILKGLGRRATSVSTVAKGVRIWDKNMLNCDKLVVASVALSIIAIPFDTEYRSILNVMVLLGLYGVYGLQKSKLKIPFVIWQILWGGVLAFGLVISRSM
jgi:hypothetical protein